MKKNNKKKQMIDFSKSVDESISQLWIDEDLENLEDDETPSSLGIGVNWHDWKNLKKGKGKLCIEMWDEKDQAVFMSLTLKQIRKMLKYLKKIERILTRLEKEKL